MGSGRKLNTAQAIARGLKSCWSIKSYKEGQWNWVCSFQILYVLFQKNIFLQIIWLFVHRSSKWLLNLCSCRVVICILYLFLRVVPWVCLRSMIVALPCHTHLRFMNCEVHNLGFVMNDNGIKLDYIVLRLYHFCLEIDRHETLIYNVVSINSKSTGSEFTLSHWVVWANYTPQNN